jgi:hypothetical protein
VTRPPGADEEDSDEDNESGALAMSAYDIQESKALRPQIAMAVLLLVVKVVLVG